MTLAELLWILIGLALIFLEFFLTSFLVVFFGVAALVTGIALTLGLPTDYGLPFFLFSFLTVAQIVLLRRKCKEIFMGRLPGSSVDDDFLHQSATTTVDFTPLPDRSGAYHGQIFFRGTQWTALSNEPLDQETRVIIIRREGSTLIVQAS